MQLPVKKGIDGLPTSLIPTDPSAFVDWFKNSFIPRWAANADIRNATPGAGVQIGGTPNAPGTISVNGLVTGVSLTDASTAPIFNTVSTGTTAVSLTETLKSQAANTTLLGPLVGAAAQPTFRLIDVSDLPASIKNNNITPDSHPQIPLGVGLGPNDEFETGATIDTAGTRYAGATPWTSFNLGTGSTSISGGSLIYTPQVGAATNYTGFTQPVSAATDWTYQAKISAGAITANQLVGMLLATSTGAAGHLYLFGIEPQTSSNIIAQRATNATTFSANTASVSWLNGAGLTNASITYLPWIYMQVKWTAASSTFVVSVSLTGLPGSFLPLLTEIGATFLGVPAMIGIGADNQASANTLAMVDWFRRVA